MRFVGRGHPAIRATHAKTLELTPSAELTERGTCVLAVVALPDPPHPLAGPVRVTVAAGDHAVTLHARANPGWDPAGPAVIRRSPLRLPRTFATHADTAAADLPRDLVAALRDPAVTVLVDVEPLAEQAPTTVLFAADPTRPDDPRLRAEYAAADSVEFQGPALLPGKTGDGARHLIVATAGPPRPGRPDGCFEYVGMPPRLAVAAAGDDGSPVVFADRAEDVLRRTPAGYRIVVTCRPADLPALLAAAERQRGTSHALVAQQDGPLLRADAGHLPELYGRAPVAVCLAAGTGADPAISAAIDGLLADGVPTKTAANALAALTGTARRAAYEQVLAAARRADRTT